MKTLNLLLSCFLFTTLLSASCDDCAIETLEEKFYIDTTQIHLEENKILIDAEGILYEAPALYIDEGGYYIESVSKKGCSWYQWKCSQCKHCNLKGVDWKCKKCKKPIEE